MMGSDNQPPCSTGMQAYHAVIGFPVVTAKKGQVVAVRVVPHTAFRAQRLIVSSRSAPNYMIDSITVALRQYSFGEIHALSFVAEAMSTFDVTVHPGQAIELALMPSVKRGEA